MACTNKCGFCCCGSFTCCAPPNDTKCFRELFLSLTPGACSVSIRLTWDATATMDCLDGSGVLTGCFVALGVSIGTCLVDFKFACHSDGVGGCAFKLLVINDVCTGCYSLSGTCDPFNVTGNEGTDDCFGFHCGCEVHQPNKFTVTE